MSGPERVVFALRPLGEAGEPAALAQRPDARAPASQDLVRVGLVSDIPDQPVPWRIEHIVQGHGQFDHTQPRAQMAARHRNRADRFGTQLVREGAQLPLR
jgi:hypothetical protein